ncbi:MAG: FAD-binding oxidoreductase [Acidimicrobiales bacterium]
MHGGKAPMDRRQFLRRAGAGVAAAMLGPAATACGRGGGGKVGTSTSAVTLPSRPVDWRSLGASLEGRLVLPSDPSYDTDRKLYNRRFDGIAPAAIAFCRSAADVQRCVHFARHAGVDLAARSGGHSYGGYSSCPGLVVDVASMASVRVAPDRATVAIGAGARLIDCYEVLGASGVLLPGGSCPTVGIAGLTLGGGVGVLGRNYGLTCDQLVSLDVVTADGRLVRCDASRHPDLFWASRGGGGGNFGIATSFTFRVHPIPPIALFTMDWPWTAAGDVLSAWQEWLPGTPPALWSNCQLLAGAGTARCRVNGVFCGQVPALSAALAPLHTAIGSAPTYDFVGPSGYLDAMLVEAGCEGKTVAQCHLPSQDPAGTLSRASFAAKSAYVSAVTP